MKMFGLAKIEERLLKIEQLLEQRFGAEFEEIKKKHQSELEQQAQLAETRIDERFGIHAKLMRSTIEVLDFDGTAKITRSCSGLRVKECSFHSVLHRIAVTNRLATWKQKPALLQRTSNKHLRIHEREGLTPERYLFDVEIDPPLREGDELDYGYTLVVTHCAAMSSEDAALATGVAALPQESVSLSVEYPWQRLDLSVSFPSGYPFHAHARVFVGRGTLNQHDSETKRAMDLLQIAENKASLVIDKPLFNFRYVIYWTAPTRSELEQIKGKFAIA